MGSGLSIPTAEINQEATTLVQTFTPLYIKHYALALVHQLKIEKNARISQYQLLKPPVPSEPLQTGTLVKQGAVAKNWKTRFFVAMNEKDNYEVRYYADEAAYKAAPEKPKGAMQLCWFRIERTTTDAEKKEFGDFSLKALPWWSSDRRRPWYIRADSEETLKKWISTFEFAARKAGPPLNPDPVMRRAFEAAYLETRWVLDEWDWYYLARTEAEQLGCLVVDRCERTCMRPVYAKIPSGAMESVVRGQVVKVLDQTVGAAVGAGWKAVSATVDANKAKVKEAVDANIGSVLEKQVEVKDRITGAILSSLQALVDKNAAPLVGPVVRVLAQPLLEAYREAAGIFLSHMGTAVEKAAEAAAPADAEKAWEASLRDFKNETFWYWGSLHPAFSKVRDLAQYNPSVSSNSALRLEIPLDEVARLLGGVALWEIERQFEEGIRELSRNAVYTLKTRSESQGTEAKKALVAEVAGAFIHDAKVRACEELQWIFSSVLLKPVRREFLPTIKAVLSPVADVIPDALKPLLDVNQMVDEIFTDVVHGAIYQVVVPTINTHFEALHGLVPGLAVATAVNPLTLPRVADAPAAAGAAASAADAAPAPAPASDAPAAPAAAPPAALEAPAADSEVLEKSKAPAGETSETAAASAPAPEAAAASAALEGVPEAAEPAPPANEEVPAAAAASSAAPATNAEEAQPLSASAASTEATVVAASALPDVAPADATAAPPAAPVVA